MTCYHLVSNPSDSAVTANGCYLEPIIPDPMEEQAAVLMAESWQLHYQLDWRCSACSDNGIDDHRVYARDPVLFSPECVVLRDGAAVGFLYKDHLILIGEPKTHRFYICRDEGYVGGWGDITETDIYTLEKRQTV